MNCGLDLVPTCLRPKSLSIPSLHLCARAEGNYTARRANSALRAALDSRNEPRREISRQVRKHLETTMRKLLAALLTVALCASIAETKPKSRIFDAPPEIVFTALLKVLKERFRVDNAKPEQRYVSFHTGISLTSNGFNGTADVRDIGGNKSEVLLNLQKKMQAFAWGAGDRIAAEIFKGIDQELSRNAPKKPKQPTDRVQ
jgi:hypothetical protein